MDAASGQLLFARDPHRRFVPASITKVMTAYVACGMLAEGKLSLDQRFKVSQGAYRDWSGQGTTLNVREGDEITVNNLLRAIMTVSANDAAVVLAEGVAGSVAGWTALMNRQARKLGMSNSHFATPNGWPDEGQTYTSAQDLAVLARALLKNYPACYARYSGHKTFTYNGVTRRSHDPITGVVAGADGIKTGFTRQAGYGFLGSAMRDGHRLVMVVAASDRGDVRGQAARRFIEWGFSAFERRQLIPANVPVGVVAVQGGADRAVPLVSAVPVTALVPHGGKVGTFTVFLRYKGPLLAPVKLGETIGEIEVFVDGKPSHSLPAIAGHDVASANFWQRLRNGLFRLLA